MVELCDGMLLLFVQRARPLWAMAKPRVRNHVGCKNRWTFNPVRSLSQRQAHLVETSQGCVRNASLNIHGTCFTRKEKDCQAICPSRTENLPASDIHVKRFKHREVAQEGKPCPPFADGFPKLFDLPQLARGEMPAR